MPKSVELKAKNACMFAWPLSLFSVSLHILLHFLFSFTSPNSLFLLALVLPGQLDLFLWICIRQTALNAIETSGLIEAYAFLLRASAAQPAGSPGESLFRTGFYFCLARDHTQPIKAYSHLFIIVSVFSKEEDLYGFLVLSLYDDSPAFLACTFLFQSVLHLQLFLLLLQMVSGTQAVLYPTHLPGTNECNSMVVTPVSWATEILDLLLATWT